MKGPVVASFPIVLLALPAVAGEVLHVSPGDSLADVGRRLAAEPGITEVVLEGGVYRETLAIPPSAGEAAPLVLRPAGGARVVFDGAIAIPKSRPLRDRPGVFWFARPEAGAEPPKLWEPDSRTRYMLVADLGAVERFAASFLVRDGRVYFHTTDGLPPGNRVILMSALDRGVQVRRPDVTVRDLEFRNFVASGKGSTGVRVDADRVTVQCCDVSNASFGFVVVKDQGALVGCTARDVGGGAYILGNDARVEACRLFKERDDFMVPGYPQDDCGIQFYHPARGGVVRGNLVVGFHIGVLIKAQVAPWLVERNTLVGRGLKNDSLAIDSFESGFLATGWHPEEIFRRNIVAGYAVPIRTPPGVELPGVERNCYWPTAGPGRRAPEAGSIVGDPGFLNPAAEDYRLDSGSACVAAAGGEGEIGFGRSPCLVPFQTAPWRAPREWHVSPAGGDATGGTGEAPLRTIQAAVDRAAPGDTILLHPGIYSEAVRITRGGEERRPITIRALEKWTAILDGNRRLDSMITIENASFVTIRDLEIRWYRGAGVQVRDSEHVTVAGCRIWNAHWGGTWPIGAGVQAENSRRFRGERNVIFSNERAFRLLRSPQATITRNTAVSNLYGAAVFIHSIEESVCRNNSFAFQGNDAIVVMETPGGKARLASFDCDYNNYGMTIQDQPPGVAVDRIVPREVDRHLRQASKAIVYYEEKPGEPRRFLTLQEWRDFSSLDGHSIIADPLYVSSATYDFRLEPHSPNIGAGDDGGTIGAFD